MAFRNIRPRMSKRSVSRNWTIRNMARELLCLAPKNKLWEPCLMILPRTFIFYFLFYFETVSAIQFQSSEQTFISWMSMWQIRNPLHDFSICIPSLTLIFWRHKFQRGKKPWDLISIYFVCLKDKNTQQTVGGSG